MIKMLFAFFIFASQAFAHISPKGYEATLRFSHWVELSPYSSLDENGAKHAIEEQLRYMVGPMANLKSPAAPRNDHKIKVILVEALPGPGGRVIAHYSYEGTVLLSKPAEKINFALPHQPNQIYRTSIASLNPGEINPCTGESDKEANYFHYYWSPDRKGCKEILKLGIDYSIVNGRVEMLPEAETSLPAYEQLTDKNGNVLIYLMVGKDEVNAYRSPMLTKNKELNAINFRKMVHQLKSLGFVGREWNLNEIKSVVKESVDPYPYLLEFQQAYDGKRTKKITVRMVYSNASSAGDEPGFLYFLEDAMQNSGVMIWDGHSGVGRNCLPGVTTLTSPRFNLRANPNRYQIFSFNTCSSYTYYNTSLLEQKASAPGRLDVISTGLETFFENGSDANIALIRAIHNWADTGRKTDYQTLLKQMENKNLVGVSFSCDEHLE